MTAILLDEEAIFHVAWKIGDREARDAYLSQVCGGDAALRGRVEALIGVVEREASFLEVAPCAATVDLPPAAERPGAAIGPYKLLERIGEGGMGVVYVAEQTQPVRRKVALKVIKPGMDSKQVIARFEAERQALALMDHPNIARVLDAGATASGHPYFVMELVKGVPITDYCDRERLPIRERLELFVLVCRAVQHAHQKGVIHRDLKPSNVLVTLHDAVPVPKVIDFGIAKATGRALTEKTLFTGIAQLVGTPQYMSPEQAELSSLDVDTRSDIYSLGVLLYELLTGTTPFDSETLRRAAFDEMRRILREENPPTPSTRLSSLGESLLTVSARRGSDPRRIGRTLRGELDWVVMKALEKDRNRRYETANGFAADLRRYLDGEAVEAHPPSTWYRLGKVAGRHRTALATTALVLAMLMGATGVSVWMAARATRAEAVTARSLVEEGRQRRRSEASEARALVERKRADREAGNARRAAADAESVLRFFQDHVLAAARPAGQDGGLGRNATIRAAVEAAEGKLAGSFANRPRVEAAIRDTLGVTYTDLGEPRRAIEQLDRARNLRRRALGADHPDTLTTVDHLALAYLDAGRTDEAIPLFEAVRERREANQGPDHPATQTSLNNLALAYHKAGRLKLAIPTFEQLRRRRAATLGLDHAGTLVTSNNLAMAYHDDGRFDEAIALLEDVQRRKERRFGPDDPRTLYGLHNLALAYRDAGRLDEAIPAFEDACRRQEATLGPNHPRTLACLQSLAHALEHRRPDRAEALFRRALDGFRDLQGPTGPKVRELAHALANFYTSRDRPAEAEPLLRILVDADRGELQVENPPAGARNGLAAALVRLGRNLLQQRKPAEAESALRESLAILEQASSQDWSRFVAMSLLGEALLGRGRPADAEPLLLEGYEGLKAREAKSPASARGHLADAGERVVRLYETWGKPGEAAGWRARLGLYDLPTDVFSRP